MCALPAKHRLILRLIIGLLVSGSLLGAVPAEAAAPQINLKADTEVVKAVSAIDQIADKTQKDFENSTSTDPAVVALIVRNYFSDIPVMGEVARCESEFIQFNKDGSIHRGEANRKDVGVMQINEKYHLSTSKKLGLNIYSLVGNLSYARFLYENEGLAPWSASAPCWKKTAKLLQAKAITLPTLAANIK